MPNTTPSPYVLDFADISLTDVASVGGKNASLGELFRSLKPKGVGVLDGFATTADAYRRLLATDRLGDRAAGDLQPIRCRGPGRIVAARARGASRGAGDAAARRSARRRFSTAYEQFAHSCRARAGNGRPVVGDGGGSAGGLVRGRRRDISQRARGGGTAARGPRLLLVAVHRSGDQLSRPPGIRPARRWRCRSASCRWSDPTRRVPGSSSRSTRSPAFATSSRSRRVRARRVRGAGCRHAGRVDGIQADAGNRPSRDHRPPAWARRRCGSSTPTAAKAREASRRLSSDRVALLADRRRCAHAGAVGVCDRSALLAARGPSAADGHRVGKGRRDRRARDRAGAARNRSFRQVAHRRHRRLSTGTTAGRAACHRAGCGRAHRRRPRARRAGSQARSAAVQPGEVLVARDDRSRLGAGHAPRGGDRDRRGGRTAHAAIVSREFGLPCIVGTGNATSALRDGDEVTVCCAEGREGHVYGGRLPFAVDHVDAGRVPETHTKVMLIVGDPSRAFDLAVDSRTPASVSRAPSSSSRITSAFIRWRWCGTPRCRTREAVKEIAARIGGEEPARRSSFAGFREGVARIAAAFYPKPVIVRTSDFKTNEYAQLLGGREFEPAEENPMIGFRGASRYYDPRYADGFALECRALLRVRRDLGLTNIKVMIPFCRTVEEGRRVIAAMARQWPPPGRGRTRSLRDVRSPIECGARRGIPAGLRRVFDRIERSDAADARTRSGFRPRWPTSSTNATRRCAGCWSRRSQRPNG